MSGAPAGTERRELTADAAALETHELRAPADGAPGAGSPTAANPPTAPC